MWTQSSTTRDAMPPPTRQTRIVCRILELTEDADLLSAQIKRREASLKLFPGQPLNYDGPPRTSLLGAHPAAKVDRKLSDLIRSYETAVGSVKALDHILQDEQQGRAS